VTAENPITDLLAAPLGSDWTIEGLAEQLLCTIASQPRDEDKKLLLDAAAATDRQLQRVLRPLLACLATKSAAEAGTHPNLYGGQLSFKRTGPDGPVWILGEFENKPGTVRVAFQRSSSPLQVSGQKTGEPSVVTVTNAQRATPASAEPFEKARKKKKPPTSKQKTSPPRKGAIRVESVNFAIVIERDFDTFDTADVEHLLNSIKQMLDRSGEVKIIRQAPR
jgi:hypothetical protein